MLIVEQVLESERAGDGQVPAFREQADACASFGCPSASPQHQYRPMGLGKEFAEAGDLFIRG